MRCPAHQHAFPLKQPDLAGLGRGDDFDAKWCIARQAVTWFESVQQRDAVLAIEHETAVGLGGKPHGIAHGGHGHDVVGTVG